MSNPRDTFPGYVVSGTAAWDRNERRRRPSRIVRLIAFALCGGWRA